MKAIADYRKTGVRIIFPTNRLDQEIEWRYGSCNFKIIYYNGKNTDYFTAGHDLKDSEKNIGWAANIIRKWIKQQIPFNTNIGTAGERMRS